jgi:hypothetical protein
MPASATHRAGAGTAAATPSCAPCWPVTTAAGFTKTQGYGRARVRSNQAQPAHQPVPATRQIRRTLGIAANHRNPQPIEAPQAPNSRRGGLKRPRTGSTLPTGRARARTTATTQAPHRTFARHPPPRASVSRAEPLGRLRRLAGQDPTRAREGGREGGQITTSM